MLRRTSRTAVVHAGQHGLREVETIDDSKRPERSRSTTIRGSASELRLGKTREDDSRRRSKGHRLRGPLGQPQIRRNASRINGRRHRGSPITAGIRAPRGHRPTRSRWNRDLHSPGDRRQADLKLVGDPLAVRRNQSSAPPRLAATVRGEVVASRSADARRRCPRRSSRVVDVTEQPVAQLGARVNVGVRFDVPRIDHRHGLRARGQTPSKSAANGRSSPQGQRPHNSHETQRPVPNEANSRTKLAALGPLPFGTSGIVGRTPNRPRTHPRSILRTRSVSTATSTPPPSSSGSGGPTKSLGHGLIVKKVKGVHAQGVRNLRQLDSRRRRLPFSTARASACQPFDEASKLGRLPARPRPPHTLPILRSPSFPRL